MRRALLGIDLSWRRWLGTALAAGAILAFALPLCRRGLVLSDEGYILQQALDMLGGKVLYRDLDAFVTPGIWWLVAATFQIVEPSVAASRIPVVVGFLAMIAVSWRIVARVAGRSAAAASIVGLLVAAVWAFPAWTFAFYSPFAMLFVLAALDALLSWRDTQRPRSLVWMGLWLGAAIAFKQNYGALAAVGAALGVLAVRLEHSASFFPALRAAIGDVARGAAGALVVGTLMLASLAWNGSLGAAFQSLVVHPFEFGDMHGIPYLGLGAFFDPIPLLGLERLTYGSTRLYKAEALPFDLGALHVLERLHVLAYWLPPAIFAIGIALARAPRPPHRGIDAPLACVVAICGVTFAGVFPRADFNHLMNVYQGVVVCGAIVVARVLERLPSPRPFWAKATCRAGVAVLALYAAAAAFWYQDLIRQIDTDLGVRRGGVLVSRDEAAVLGGTLQFIRKNTRNGDALLTVPDLSMVNFLAERKMPSRYYNLYEHHIAHDSGAGVVEGSRSSGARLAITTPGNFFSDRVGLREYAGVLLDHLRRDFDMGPRLANGSFLSLTRREQPRPATDRTEILEDCDLDPMGTRGRVVREQLLFSSLQHFVSDDHLDLFITTRCVVTVPDDGELVVRMGHLEPLTAEAGATASAEVLVEREDGFEELLSESFQVVGPPAFSFPAPREFRADVSHLAGERVILVFRSRAHGKVVPHVDALGEFAVLWEDPRIESPPRQAGSDD